MDIDALIKAMTIEEKAGLCSGKNLWQTKPVERLNIPSITMADGPHGLRKEKDDSLPGMNDSLPAVCFPTAVAMASSWDKPLIESVGKAIANHAKSEGVHILLGPGVNIKRSPLCGRNFEYYSEDPRLSAHMAEAFIKGVESQGVGTSIKHYAANNQETRRMSIDARVDARALHEIYLPAFKHAITKAHPATVMTSYNRLNGIYASEHPELINDTLRKDWGFEGATISDWGATNDRVLALKAGLDIEMPASGGDNDRFIVEAIKKKTLSESVLNERVRTILTLIKRYHIKTPLKKVDLKAQHQLAKKVAAESMVLLKNDNGVLPLEDKKQVALIGAMAETLRYQGAGSSRIKPTKLSNVLECFTQDKRSYTYAQGYHLNQDKSDEALVKEALTIAKKSDVIIVCAGLSEAEESEAFDRKHLDLSHAQNTLIETLTTLNKPVVVVLFAGSAVLMPWADQVTAILHAHLPGQAGAEALSDLLYGLYNPSGKLSESYPLNVKDHPVNPVFGKNKVVEPYLESIYVGYRYYDTADKAVRFPFGHGLSYTTFDYGEMTLDKGIIKKDEPLSVSLEITNTGTRAGQEVVQLYISMLDSEIFREKQALKTFEKVSLKPQETKTITFKVTRDDLTYYDIESEAFEVENGLYEIRIGASSRDIRRTGTFVVNADEQPKPVPESYKKLNHFHDLNTEDHPFALDHLIALSPVPYPTIPSRRRINLNTPVTDMRHRFIGRILHKQLLKQIDALNHPDETSRRMMAAVILEMPLRSVAMMSQGALSLRRAQGLVDLMNFKVFRGLIKVIIK